MDLTTWAQHLALPGVWRVARPKTMRLKHFATAARHINAARRRIIDLDPDWPWAPAILKALTQLAGRARLAPDRPHGTHPTADDPNQGHRHRGPWDKHPRPNGLTPEKSKANRNQQSHEIAGLRSVSRREDVHE